MLWQKIKGLSASVSLLLVTFMVVVSSLPHFRRLLKLYVPEVSRIRRMLYVLIRPFLVLSLAVVILRLLLRTRKYTMTRVMCLPEPLTMICSELLPLYRNIVSELVPSDFLQSIRIVRAISLTVLFPKLVKRFPLRRLNALPVLAQVLPLARLASRDQVIAYLDPCDA